MDAGTRRHGRSHSDEAWAVRPRVPSGASRPALARRGSGPDLSVRAAAAAAAPT
eukprot:COSAG01_NODE_11970_length_1824_cov_30.286957_2_plen_53_part_01